MLLITAEPSLDFPSHWSHYVRVPVGGSVLTQLTCDIGPGLARQSYSLQWRRLSSGNGFTTVTEGVNEETFTLTIPTTTASNNVMYMCTVFIDHDSSGSYRRLYDGARITVKTAGKPYVGVYINCLHYPTQVYTCSIRFHI